MIEKKKIALNNQTKKIEKEKPIKDNSKKEIEKKEQPKPEEKKQSETKPEKKITEIKQKNIIQETEEEFHGEESFGRVIAPVLQKTEARQTLENQLQETNVNVKKEKSNEKETRKQDVYSAANIYNQQIYDAMNKYSGEQEIFEKVREGTKQLVEGVKMFDTRSKFQKEMLRSQETMRPQQVNEEPKYEFQRIEAKTTKVPGMKREREEVTSAEKVKKYRVHGI